MMHDMVRLAFDQECKLHAGKLHYGVLDNCGLWNGQAVSDFMPRASRLCTASAGGRPLYSSW
jgi:hypothetical protein